MDASDKTQSSEQQRAHVRQIAKSTATMSMATLVSRATGFIRTWAMAFALGNTVLSASYSLANNLPNMVYELVAGGVLSTAFLPIYLQQRNTRSREDANAYASNLLSLTIVLLGIIALAASIFAPQFIWTQSLFSNTSNETVESATWLFRFFAFQILFYGISAVFSGLLNAERAFFWPAVSSIFMNIVNIVTFFSYPFIYEYDSQLALTVLAVGATLAIAVLAFVQLPALLKSGFRFRFHIDLHGEGLRATVKLALPAIACTAINLVSLSFMNSCALHVADNGPSSVSYAWMWYQFPYGVLSVALSTAMFTEMSESMAKGDTEGFKRDLKLGLYTTWLLIIPMTVLLFVCAEELIGLYTAGRFTSDNIYPIAQLLRGWAIALPLYSGYMYLFRAYSSLKDLKTVAICNLIFTCVQITLYMLLTGVIEVPGFDNALGLVGLACGDIVFYTLMLTTLLLVMRKRVGTFGFKDIAQATAKVSIASLLGGAIAMLVSTAIKSMWTTTTIWTSLITLIVVGCVGLVAILVFCRLLHVDEVLALVKRVAGHILRKG